MKDKASTFNESKYAFEIFAEDLLVTDDIIPRLILMEVNDKVGYAEINKNSKRVSPDYEKFPSDYFDWCFQFYKIV